MEAQHTNTSADISYVRLSPFISIVTVIASLIVWLGIVLTIYAYMNLDYIRSNWDTEKCKPAGILIGGKDNLKECVKPILGEVVAKATFPLTYGAVGLSQIFLDISKAVQQLRIMFDYMRISMDNIARDIFGRIVNLMIPLQTIFITVKDMFARLYAVFAASLYMGLATILTMKKILEMILTFVIIILIALASLIIMMWIFPFSWGVAATFTAIFVSISIPLAMFVSAVGKVTDLGIPKIPSKPHVCFDKHTQLILEDNTICPIYKIKIGDVLRDGSIVLSKLKLDKGDAVMYYLNGVLVSGTHLVKYYNTWIPVSFHPSAVKIPKYNKKTIYCINTSTGKIRLINNEFTDWDEMLDPDFSYNKKGTLVELMSGELLPIKEVKLGDVLKNGKVVTGFVKTIFMNERKNISISTVNSKTKYYHLYTK